MNVCRFAGRWVQFHLGSAWTLRPLSPRILTFPQVEVFKCRDVAARNTRVWEEGWRWSLTMCASYRETAAVTFVFFSFITFLFRKVRVSCSWCVKTCVKLHQCAAGASQQGGTRFSKTCSAEWLNDTKRISRRWFVTATLFTRTFTFFGSAPQRSQIFRERFSFLSLFFNSMSGERIL